MPDVPGDLAGFGQISDELSPYISPYLSTLAGPQDAVTKPLHQRRDDG